MNPFKHLAKLRVLAALIVATGGVAMGQCGGGACNSYGNIYFPIGVGSKWTYRNTSTSSPVVITIQSSPSTFGCAPPSGPTGIPSPVWFTLYKIDPLNYWAPNYQANLDWFLGITSAEDVVAFGHYWLNFDDGNPPNSGTNWYETASGYNPATYPPYVLLRAAGSSATAPTVPMSYWSSTTNADFSCVAPPGSPSSGNWEASWSSGTVSTPGYSGSVVVANYYETSSGFSETWYYAYEVGVVQITSNTDGITLQLVDHAIGSGTPVLPKVSFRDMLTASAAATSGLDLYQWNYYYTAVTGISGPTPNNVCVSSPSSPMTVDQYISALANWGTSCSDLSWSMTELNQVASLAGSSAQLTWDQWNYYDSEAGYSPLSVTQVCMSSETYYDDTYATDETVYPNRYAIYTVNEWFDLVGWARNGGTCS